MKLLVGQLVYNDFVIWLTGSNCQLPTDAVYTLTPGLTREFELVVCQSVGRYPVFFLNAKTKG